MSHSVTLNWIDLVNPSGTTYNIYRIAPGSTTPVKVGSNIAAKTATDVDPSLNIGDYTYQVTSVDNGVESAPASVTVGIPPAPPTGLTAAAT